MAKEIQLKAAPRRGSLSSLRRQGDIPAVLYGHGLKSRSLRVGEKKFSGAFKEAGHTSIISLNLASSDERPVLIREVQLHPVKGDILHVDFYQVRMDEKTTADVPIVFKGEAPAVKDRGGVLVRSIDVVELEALPQHLPHDIQVDISILTDFDQVIHVKDLSLPKGVELLHEPEEVVASVQPPRTEEELEAELAEEAAEDVEKVEGVKEEEIEEADEGGKAEESRQQKEGKSGLAEEESKA